MSSSFPPLIVDAHHHLWDLDQVHYPWLAANGVERFFGNPAPIQQNYLPADFIADIAELPITQSVHIQVGAADHQHVAESRWLQRQIDGHQLPNAMVVFCDLAHRDYQQQLAQHLQFRSVKGVRQIVGRSPQEDKLSGTHQLLETPAWLQGLKALPQLNLSFDLQLIPEQMQTLSTILKQAEAVNVALCHCGSPWPLNRHYDKPEYWLLWRQGLRSLAELPNVYCKISGLAMFQRRWDQATLAPIIETVIETFGVKRCMFGSNFPVDKLHTSYQTIWNSYQAITQHYSVSERQALFADNAINFYRLTR